MGHRYLTHPVEDAYWQSAGADSNGGGGNSSRSTDYFASTNRPTTTIDEHHEIGGKALTLVLAMYH